MEGEEGCDDHSQHACQYVGSHDKVGVLIVETLGIRHCAAQNGVGSAHDEPIGASAVEEHA